jgi:hypothetical protein
LHQVGNESKISKEAVELRDQELRAVFLGEGDGVVQGWSRFSAAAAPSTCGLFEVSDQFPPAIAEIALNSRLLTL